MCSLANEPRDVYDAHMHTQRQLKLRRGSGGGGKNAEESALVTGILLCKRMTCSCARSNDEARGRRQEENCGPIWMTYLDM